MKTKIKFLAIIALVMTIFSCSEDIYLEIDAKDGKDGKDGASYVYRLLFEQEDNCLIVKVYQNEKLLSVQGPICFDFEIPNPPIPSIWYQDIPLNEECYERNWYYDFGGAREYLIGKDTICKEIVPNLTAEIISLDELCKIWVFYVDEKEILRDTICNGESPEQYIPVFSTELIPLDELCNLRKVFIDGDLFYSDTLCNGEPGEIKTKTIIREKFFEDCNNPGNSSFYKSEDWIFNKRFSINQVGSDSGNGTLVYSGIGKDTIWSPKLFSEPMSVDSISLHFNSRQNYETQVFLVNSSGEIFLVDKIKTTKNSYFNWQELETFHNFNYSASINDLEFQDIVRIGFIVENSDSKKSNGRNFEFNSDNIFVRGVKIID